MILFSVLEDLQVDFDMMVSSSKKLTKRFKKILNKESTFQKHCQVTLIESKSI